jgi:lipopolysaccharide biosynthesis protein
MNDNKLRPIAIYLPQYHPTPENDAWWGKGFTEWTNVAKAKPLFNGHYQPQLPTDLGFYDLRLPEARQAQADLAKEHGIHGFCYYHYWFNGKRILERPFQEVFESGKPDFPFMLCWANENWTKVWDGGENQILLKQDYSFEDDLKHIQALIPYFKDPRYIRIHNKPVFAIYRSTLLPDVEKTLMIWRNEAAKHNLELYVCRVESWGTTNSQYLSGFDAAIDFAPFSGLKVPPKFLSKKESFLYKIKNRLNRIGKHIFSANLFSENTRNFVYNYDNIITENKERLTFCDYKLFPCCTPGWDNTSRRKQNRIIVKDNTPDKFGEWFNYQIDYSLRKFEAEEQLVFINAWNEWAEGNHLEPCLKWGRAYLEQVKRVLDKYNVIEN